MRNYLKSALIALIACATSCEETEKHNKLGVLDNDTTEYELYDYYEDRYGNKGIIAACEFIDEKTTDYRFTIVMSLDETITTWGPMGTAVFDIAPDAEFNPYYAYTLFFGLDMNRRVMNNHPERYPAFDWCFQKNGGEKMIHSSSWMLPTAKELNYIFKDGDAIEDLNRHLTEYGGTPITLTGQDDIDTYWTCVEDLEDVITFEEETQKGCDFDPEMRAIPTTSDNRYYTNKLKWNKYYNYRVRAIKYIYFECTPRTFD